MCRIIVNKANMPFDMDELKESYAQNSDGTGLFYYDTIERKTHICKYAKGTPFDTIWEAIQNINNPSRAERFNNVILHFRLGTSGGIGEQQIHPIPISNNFYVFHNGIMPDYEWDTQQGSDTQCFAFYLDTILRIYNIKTIKQLRDNKMLCAYIAHKVGANKIVIAQHDENIILNDYMGEYVGYMWKSGKHIDFYFNEGEPQYNINEYIDYEKEQEQAEAQQRLLNLSKRAARKIKQRKGAKVKNTI